MRHPRRQQGAVAILVLTALVLGIAWFAVGALGRAPVASPEREIVTGRALQAGKEALLAYVAQYAARPDTAEPGQMPCPESLTLANPGASSTSCSASALVVGRLPWKTLGVDELRDGYGEPLWYVMRGFRDAPINFSTPGQLTHNGATVVAMIVAPGVPLNTTGTAPAGCSAQNQQVTTRNTGTLVPTNFIECGTTTGVITTPGDSSWTNDRVLSITAVEWADAIAGPVADRLQRQVAPAIRNWDAYELTETGKNWGMYGQAYLPFASNWGDPTTTDYCGDQGTVRGLMPIDSTCYNEKWELISATTGGLLSLFGSPNCTDQGTFMRCRFQRILGVGSATARVILRARDAGRAFRGSLQASDISTTNSGTKDIFAMVVDNGSSDAYIVIDFTWPPNVLLLAIGQVVTADIPHLQIAAIHTDPSITWFVNNGWHRYAWYAVSPGATPKYNNSGSVCAAAGDPGCLTVNGLSSDAGGNLNDKVLVLVLSGRALSTQATPSADLAQYFEAQNASVGVIYEIGSVDASFNDRVAACPFRYTAESGTITVCN